MINLLKHLSLSPLTGAFYYLKKSVDTVFKAGKINSTKGETLMKTLNKLLKAFFLICIVISIADSNANDYIHLGMVSYHQNRDIDYNETHASIGIEKSGYFIGYYKNSHYKDSFFAMKTIRALSITDKIHFGAKVGLVTGYDFKYTYKGVTAGAIPTLFFDFKPVSIDVNIIPTQVYSIQFKFSF